uniref:Uncharacterized protein n=1 Tax=Arundo donax TaxID=35708 RepID=A0A0A9E754_ARUDO
MLGSTVHDINYLLLMRENIVIFVRFHWRWCGFDPGSLSEIVLKRVKSCKNYKNIR